MSGTQRRKRKRIDAINKERLEREEEEAKVSPNQRTRRKRKSTEQGRPLYDLPEDEVEDDPKPKRQATRRRSTRRPIPEDRKDVEYAEKPVEIGQLPKNLQKTLDGRFLTDLIQALSLGQALTIVRKSEDVWTLGVGGTLTVDSMLRLSGQDYVDEVTSDEWKQHQEDWDALTSKEKIKIAKDAGAEWEQHSNSRINMMRCATAYQEILQLEKYKSQYRFLAARNAIRARK